MFQYLDLGLLFQMERHQWHSLLCTSFVGCLTGKCDMLPLAWEVTASVHWLLPVCSLMGGKSHSAICGLHRILPLLK